MKVILFDERINSLNYQIFKCLIEKREIYVSLVNDFIDLEEMKKRLEQFIGIRQNL